MRGFPAIVDALNAALTHELTATNQYFLAYRMLDNWGYDRLAHHFYEESIEEMRHADSLIQRLLFFEGHPNLQRLNHVGVGESPREILDLALDLEVTGAQMYRDAIA